ncbi:pyridoxal phosphate-dependent aminotransferase [Candidatus Woesearchaeota archaeon]|nr:pyridoxal phosphate-dependent aminotransferase [Candidatus Woesearchaeota archaeon]
MIAPSSYLLWLEQEARPIKYDLFSSAVFPGELTISLPACTATTPFMNGSPELRSVIAQKYDVHQENVLVTTGVSVLNTLILQTFTSPHYVAAIESPVYEPLLRIAESNRCVVMPLHRRYESAYALPLPSYQPDMIVLTNPHNPSGVSLPHRNLEELAAYADTHKTIVLVDEVYNDSAFERSPPFCTMTKYGLSVSHLNKSYGLGVLKVGWVVGDEELIVRIAEANTLFHADVFCAVDKKAQEVLQHADEFRQQTLARLRSNHTLMADWISSHPGISWVPSNGTPVCFIKVPIRNTLDFVNYLIDHYQTRVVPGSFFGAEGFLRIGYGCREDVLREGLARLGDGLQTWKEG